MGEQTTSRGAWYEAAKWTAVVTGILCAAAAVVLIVNHARTRLKDPLDSPDLVAMRETLRDNPRDADLKARIRDLDLQLRTEYFRRQTVADRGGYVLIGGLVLFIISVRYVMHRRKDLPMPKPKSSAADQDRAATHARLAVGAAGVLVAGLALLWGLNGMTGCRVESVEIDEHGNVVRSGVTADPDGSAGGQGGAEVPKLAAPPSAEEVAAQWPRFRGPGGLGIAAPGAYPTAWDGASGENILWKAEAPLPGQSSPTVWGKKVFVTGGNADERVLYCFHADTGDTLWTAKVETPQGKAAQVEPMEDTGYAAASPATDGRFVCAMFANGDLACFDLEGNQKWAVNLGTPDNMYGHASSPILFENLVIVQFDQATPDDGKSKLVAYDLTTGKQAYAAPRAVAASWSTPIVIDAAGRKQLISTSAPLVMSQDPATGKEIWQADVFSGDVAASPVFAGGLVYATSVSCELLAIKPDGTGDVTDTHIPWGADGDLPDTTSPVANDEHVWIVSTSGLLQCFDAKTGDLKYEQDLDMSVNGSPSLAGGSLYVLSKKGRMVIAGTGGEFEEQHRAELGEASNSSPAFVDGRIYIRGKQNLYAIGAK